MGKNGHQGRGFTIGEIRNHGIWIIGCSSEVARHIKNCVTCRRQRGQFQVQKMADLPPDRLEPGPPFTHCAVDYFGPFLVKEGRRQLKRYGALFTCLSSRAIHIEVADALSTDSFINVLRCFMAIRGPIKLLRSDQGTNFVGAQNEFNVERVRHFLADKGADYFEFRMNVPKSSHMGGAWERQIRTVRSVLSGLLDQSDGQLNDQALRTLFYEVMSIVNSRPLAVETLSDPTILEPLTPNHLLTRKCRVLLPPPGNFERIDLYTLKQWRRVQYLTNIFWQRWRSEYLAVLQPRQKWTSTSRNMRVDDIVIINDESIGRNEWPLARVSQVYPSSDGRVRKVQLALADKAINSKEKRVNKISYLNRPIHKLILLMESEPQSE